MLKSLSIKNYALIESIEIQFESGLNIITGETGAGKSIIIDALSLILGERASADEIRKGAEKAVVEGILAVAGNKMVLQLLHEHELDASCGVASDELILRREVSAKGQSRCFVNDTPVALNVLKSMGDALVDLHGQHEHQSLLRSETHIGMLDDFGGLHGLVAEYRTSYDTLTGLFAEYESLKARERQLKERRDLYEFQMKEIDEVNPTLDEEIRLNEELRILENAEKLFEATSQLHQMLYEGETAVYDALVRARNQLQDLAEIDKQFEDMRNECQSAAAIVGEITKFVQSYNSKIEFNPERLEEIRERLGALSMLKKKYGGTLDAVIEHRASIGKEFAIAENFDGELKKLESRIGSLRKTCSESAQRLSAKRQELVPRVNRLVAAELTKLGIPNGKFEVRVENTIIPAPKNGQNARLTGIVGQARLTGIRQNGMGGQARLTGIVGQAERVYVAAGREGYVATATGIDNVEFFLSTNTGEDVKPLAKVASGGEVSRVMLALKSILAK
ncbi:MAG: DNA repair protein RecN, partial [Ignavibacteriales bacterium]|nr:DNA repair protein RecN [Ignavibacteriales bacterium]